MALSPVISVGAVDDHPVVLRGVGAALAAQAADVRLTGTATSVDELLLGSGSFDVVLLDLRLDDGSGPAENTARLRSTGAGVVVYTDGARPAQAWAAVRAGALGVLDKAEPMEVVVDAVRKVAVGDTVVSVRLARAMEAAPRLEEVLSAQERLVLRLYAGDLPAKSVARRLSISEDNVKDHLKRIRSNLAKASIRANTKLELRDVADVMGLIGDGPPTLRRA